MFVDSVVSLLPVKFQGAAKAIAPIVVAVVVAVVNAIDTGLGWKEALIVGLGVVTGAVVHQTPNKPVHADIEEVS